MTTLQKRAIVTAWSVVLIVFSFLLGYLVSEAAWFRATKMSILHMLGQES